jgi:hypothetical protein
MPLQRGCVRPELDKDRAQRILTINLDAVLEAARLSPRSMHMFKADAPQFLKGGFSCNSVAGDDDHTLAPIVQL